MKYALISDVHGNADALYAVLADAESQGVQSFLLLGDYVEDLPYPNEVVDAIRALPSAVVIRGNKEDYLQELVGQDQSAWDSEQLAVIRWNFQQLTPQNLEYLISLPAKAEVITERGTKIWLSHSSQTFYRTPRMEAFHSGHFLTKKLEAPFDHGQYLEEARESVLARADVMAELALLPEGVYAFGHNHLQFHMRLGGVYCVNPGSCGVPLEFDSSAPYTIFEESDAGWIVTERRVPYDVEGAIAGLMASSLYEKAELWSKIIICQLRTGGDYISHYLRHVKEIAASRGEPVNPVSNDVWRGGVETFKLLDLR